MSQSAEVQAESMRTAVTRAVGAELRSVREERGIPRVKFVRRLPSRMGERTLLAYEHGIRQLTLARLVELTEVLEIDPAVVVTRGLQRARLSLQHITLHVDLNALLGHDGPGRGKFRVMNQWARNALNEHPNGIAEIDTKVVRNLALFAGCSHQELAEYLAQFTPPPDVTGAAEEKGRLSGRYTPTSTN